MIRGLEFYTQNVNKKLIQFFKYYSDYFDATLKKKRYYIKKKSYFNNHLHLGLED